MTYSQPSSRFGTLTRLVCGVAMTSVLSAQPDFIHEVVPILKKNCAECHTDMKKKGGL